MGGHYSRRPLPSREISDFCGIALPCCALASARAESAHFRIFCNANARRIVIKLYSPGILQGLVLCRLTVPCESCWAVLQPAEPQKPRIPGGFPENRDSLHGEPVVCPLRNQNKGIKPLCPAPVPLAGPIRPLQPGRAANPSCGNGKHGANPFPQMHRDGSWPVALCRPRSSDCDCCVNRGR